MRTSLAEKLPSCHTTGQQLLGCTCHIQGIVCDDCPMALGEGDQVTATHVLNRSAVGC